MTVIPLRMPITTLPAPVPDALRIAFEVVIVGERRLADAHDMLEALRRAADDIGTATVGFAPPLPTDISTPRDASTPPASPAIQVFPTSRTVTRAGAALPLTRVEYDLLLFLADHPRRAFTREQLLRSVWRRDFTGPRTVDVHIRRLRMKVAADVVTTIRGIGYRLSDRANVTVIR